ncbi:YxeA family protein [Pseudobacillus badius]|uniref:YxeA family protein n=1 Tax=Bacillus badius TaxID=1455 RepID=UPI0007B05993|nr:YxeA family protein [Bacillus badius]KZN98312.1 hypothetical protein A4244_09905 [Bacillus badius]MED0666793.1 YxeA family protein [Bacillus badius]OCS82681.1 hypothetical protein A6M11_09920 [Bacillus badius]OVE51387.1 hypothetical protein B1A98_11845 [Bacillus badius]TDW02489.1 uncharacterized protein (TIGR01655 family) [Bacillus badius]
MKKIILSFIILAGFLIGGVVFLQTVNINRLGADNYFTQIKGEGKKLEEKADTGEKFVRYEYELPAFDKNGKEKTVTFTSQKQLREQAYLKLYVKGSKGVTSYEEVKKEEMPEKAKEKLG